jgi:hypothetical protein
MNAWQTRIAGGPCIENKPRHIISFVFRRRGDYCAIPFRPMFDLHEASAFPSTRRRKTKEINQLAFLYTGYPRCGFSHCAQEEFAKSA